MEKPSHRKFSLNSEMPYYNKLITYFDGGSKNNPYGTTGCGWTFYEMNRGGNHGAGIASGQAYLGYRTTNNQAEYEGLEAVWRI